MSPASREPESGPGPKVFITYRREETGPHAGRLYDAMVARFGEDNVFMDVDMAPGVDFVERITEAVAACQVLIVVMGPRWATVEDDEGTQRIADPGDFVRLELKTALRRPDVTPIPVLVAGARMPNPEDLPPEVRAITRRNAIELSDQRWRSDVGRLISTLDELLAETLHVPGPTSPERRVATAKAAPADATVSVATKPAAPPARGRRGLRWALLGAVAIAAIVVAVVVAVGGGGSPTPTTDFSKTDLPHLVLSAEEEPGNLVLKPEASGPDVHTDNLPSDAQGSYLNVFAPLNNHPEPLWYSESAAAVFKDADAAQGALDILKRDYQGPDFETVAAPDLGDDRLAVMVTGSPRPEYRYSWRTGNLLQVFDLEWSSPPANEDTARDFADKMDSLITDL